MGPCVWLVVFMCALGRDVHGVSALYLLVGIGYYVCLSADVWMECCFGPVVLDEQVCLRSQVCLKSRVCLESQMCWSGGGSRCDCRVQLILGVLGERGCVHPGVLEERLCV